MRIGCQIGIWQGMTLQQAIAATSGVGAVGIETFTTHLAPYHNEPGSLKALLTTAGLRLSGAYFNSDGFVDTAEEDAVVVDAVAALDCIRAVDGDFIVINGGVAKGDPPREFSDEDFTQFAAVLRRIAGEAAQRDVGAVVHPHVGCMVETPSEVDRLRDTGIEREGVGLCVHAAHQLLAGEDPYIMYERHGDWVRYAHIGNSRDGKGDLVGEGVLDQKRLMRPMLEAGFDGWIIIESGKDDVGPADYARDAVAYMKSAWPEVNSEV
jgi:inosose dehydratase